jgi:hypothetical protein
MSRHFVAMAAAYAQGGVDRHAARAIDADERVQRAEARSILFVAAGLDGAARVA